MLILATLQRMEQDVEAKVDLQSKFGVADCTDEWFNKEEKVFRVYHVCMGEPADDNCAGRHPQ